MRGVGRVSLPSFVAGAVCAAALVSVPAIAAVTGADQNPTVFDGTAPSLTVQPAQFVIGQTIDAAGADCLETPTYNYTIPIRLAWNATDTTSGVASFDIYENTADAGTQLYAASTSATTLNVNASNYDNGCGGGAATSWWWIVARDHRGLTALSSILETTRTAVWDEAGVDHTGNVANLAVTRTGAWSTSTCTCHNHGATTFTTAKNAAITYTLNVDQPGRTVAIVSPTSSNRGVMNVSVDGGAAQSVNTFATTTVNRVIVWQKSLNAGTHTIKITNAGTMGRGRIDVDTIMLGPAWSGEALAEYSLGDE